jgi:toxin ParE1/3/4
MRKIRLHARAETDLIEIWLHSFEEWDEAQADRYVDRLNSAIRTLATNAHRGVKRDNILKGYRVLFVNRHAVYYIVTSTTVEVVRVLHAQMDPDRHLEGTS